MTKKRLQIFLTLITTVAITAAKSDDTVEALQKILKEINAQVEERYDDGNHDSKILYHPRHYKHGTSKHSRGSPHLMNIQTMNLFMKPNKRQREEADAKTFPHTDVRENMCKSTGRCGCSGTRCGNNREDDLTEEVDRVINKINKGLARDDDVWNKYGDGVHVDDERDKRNRDVRDDDYDERGTSFEDSKNRIYKNDLLNSKKIKVNDDLDVVILDKSDLDILLRNEDFVDLTRKDVDKVDDDREIYEKVRKELKTIITAEDKTSYRPSDVLTMQDLFIHFKTVKRQAIAKVLKYLKNNNIKFINLKYLSPKQKKLLQNLKIEYTRGQLQDDDLEEKIENIIFGEHSNMKIVAQTDNNNSIYIPQWIYDKVIISKKMLNEPILRATGKPAQKRILPLTLQQKERKYNKEKGKTIPKLVWRKNAGQDIERFGIPFDFEVHGLGQVAP